MDPPITFTAASLVRSRAKFWFRYDIVLVNTLVPFQKKLEESERRCKAQRREVGPAELEEAAAHAARAFAVLTAQVATQVGVACVLVEHGSERLRTVAYEFEVHARVKGRHYRRLLESLRMPRFACNLAAQGAAPPTADEVRYEEESDPVAATLQRHAIPCAVGYLFFLLTTGVTAFREYRRRGTEDKVRLTSLEVLRGGAVRLVNDVASMAWRVGAVVLAHHVLGLDTQQTFIVGELVCSAGTSVATPRLTKLTRSLVTGGGVV